MDKKKRKIDLVKVALIIFCALLIVLIFKTFLIPMVLSMINILLKLVDLYKLLEMPYLFFGSAFFLILVWYIFSAICNITYELIEFVMTTNIYSSEKKNDSGEEIRDGAYCTQCGKHIEKDEWIHRDGIRVYYFFHLLKRNIWESYFCSNKCWKKFVRTSGKRRKVK